MIPGRIVLVIAVAATFVGPLAYSEEVTINDVFGRFGYTTEPQSGKVCALKMTIDRKAFIEAAPKIVAMGMLNPEYVTQTRMNEEPTVLSLGFSFQMVPAVVKDYYDGHASADKCKFIQSIVVQDDFGNDQPDVLFTFDFTRALYNKINWDKFSSANLSKVAPNFRFGPAMQQVLHEREEFGD